MQTASLFAAAFAANMMIAGGAAYAQQSEAAPAPAPLTAETVNAAPLTAIPPELTPEAEAETAEAPAADTMATDETESPPPDLPDASVVRLQVLLDRAGSSPGAIDGFDGDNVRKAVIAYELMQGLTPDGILDPELLARIESPDPVIGTYTITAEDAADITGPVPADYAEKAQMEFLGYASVAEKLAEHFHMDIDLLNALNPGAQFVPGEQIAVAGFGPNRDGEVARIEADKSLRQVRAYDAAGTLLVAYPATIGSEENPSPTGTHLVNAVAPMPNYTYNPAINFQQGENTEVLTIPPGPNGPVEFVG